MSESRAQASPLFLQCVLMALVMTGCGIKVGNPGDPDGDEAKVNGVAVMGYISGATVSVFQVTSDGQIGEQLTSATTSGSGQYSLILRYSGPILIRVAGGQYADEATGETVANMQIDSVATVTQGDAAIINTTSLTHIASYRSLLTLGQGGASMIRKSQDDLAALMGVSGVDLSTVTPDDFTAEGAEIDETSAPAKYGMVLSGLSQMLVDGAFSPTDLPNYVEQLAVDFADGAFDDAKDGEPIDDVFVSSSRLREDLPIAINNFLGGERNRSGIPPKMQSPEHQTPPSGGNFR